MVAPKPRNRRIQVFLEAPLYEQLRAHGKKTTLPMMHVVIELIAVALKLPVPRFVGAIARPGPKTPRAKQKTYRVVLDVGEDYFKPLKAAAAVKKTSITQFVAALVARRFRYKPQMMPRKFTRAAA
jgi:hypothetical protein